MAHHSMSGGGGIIEEWFKSFSVLSAPEKVGWVFVFIVMILTLSPEIGCAIFSESFVPDNLYCDRLYGSSNFSVCKEFVYESLFFSADAFRQGSTALADMDSEIWRCSAADDDDDRCGISVLAG